MFREVYQNGIDFSGNIISLSEFIKAPIVVNNIQYPSFLDLTQRAEILLDPSSLSRDFIYGLGDCHGGNVLVENAVVPIKEQDILYIDYEFAGYHSFLLDFVNPFFIDVFFDITCNDATLEPIDVQAAFRDGTVVITLNLSRDTLNSAILEIKTRYLVEPLVAFMKAQGADLSKIVEQIASAFFMCGSSKQHWPGGWDEFFARSGVGVALSQIKQFTEVREVWESLH